MNCKLAVNFFIGQIQVDKAIGKIINHIFKTKVKQYMFFKFFNWLKKKEKKEKCENKKDFGKAKAEVDNANSVDINANIKIDGEIVKDLTDNDSASKVSNGSVTKDLLNARERLSLAREKYYAANIAGRIIRKVLDKGIVAIQGNGINLDGNGLGDLGEGIFIDFGKIYRLKGLKFMQKGVIVQSGVIEKLGDRRNRSWEINISIPEFYEGEDCRKVINWEERDIVGEFRKEVEGVMNCEYEQNFRIINSGVCKFVGDEELVRKVVREAIWEEFGWNRNGSRNERGNGNENGNGVKGENLSNENFGKVFFPKTGEWVDVRGKCEDINGEFMGSVCREIVEGIKKFGVGRERFGIGNDSEKDGSLSNNNYRHLTINLKIRKGEIWKKDSKDGVKNRWKELGKDVREVIGSVGKDRFLDMARKTSELMRFVEEKYGIERVWEIRREVENGNKKIRECKKEIEGIIGGNGVGEENDSEATEEAMLKMEEVVGEVQERLREVMGEEIWGMYEEIVGGE